MCLAAQCWLQIARICGKLAGFEKIFAKRFAFVKKKVVPLQSRSANRADGCHLAT